MPRMQTVKRLFRVIEERFPSGELWLVGGCVRDMVKGIEPKDYDLTGNIPPRMLCEIVGGTETEKLGTVFFRFEDTDFEYTPFRREGQYDGRKPSEISFDNVTLLEDMSRRDFTINALYYHPEKGMAKECKNTAFRELTAVGNPVDRFSEDYLRILRGCRFSVKYKLPIQCGTMQTMKKTAPLVMRLSGERIQEELLKGAGIVGYFNLLDEIGLLCLLFPELEKARGLDQRVPEYHKYDTLTHMKKCAETAQLVYGDNPLFCLAALLHDIGKPKQYEECWKLEPGTEQWKNARKEYAHEKIGAEYLRQRLRDLRFTKADIKYIAMLVEVHQHGIFKDDDIGKISDKQIRKFIAEYGASLLNEAIDLMYCDRIATGRISETLAASMRDEFKRRMNEVLELDNALSIRDLKVNGHDLMALGYHGKAIGDALEYLLQVVLENPKQNDKNTLLSLLK